MSNRKVFFDKIKTVYDESMVKCMASMGSFIYISHLINSVREKKRTRNGVKYIDTRTTFGTENKLIESDGNECNLRNLVYLLVYYYRSQSIELK